MAVCLAALVLVGCGKNESRLPQSRDLANDVSESDHVETSDPSASQAIENSIGMTLVRIPAGEFSMGSSETDSGAREDEMPQHRVKITGSFYMGAHEVTQGQFEAVMGKNPSSFSRGGMLKDAPADLDLTQFPVDGVTWYDAQEFCRRLSESPHEKRGGRSYRLPTEAEWEYACRAGTTTTFHFGDSLSSDQANFNGNDPFGDAEPGPFLNRTTTVGSYAPNAFGLYDMHGNLNEWCSDRFDREFYGVSPQVNPQGSEMGSSRVIRGGDWYSDGRDCRSAFRYADIPEGKFYALGFRVVCESANGADRLATSPVVVEPPHRTESKVLPAEVSERAAPNSGEDWPRWRGPRADGTWNAPKLPTTFPEAGLPQVWRNELGGGYGGISVSDGRVCVMDRQEKPEEVERVVCFDAADGDLLWSRSYPVDYSGVSYGSGPRATPTLFEERVYTLGALGHLLCLNAEGGDVVWSKDLVNDVGARVPLWGLSASPVVFDDLLIVHAGAEPDGCYIAFERTTGEERWRSLPDPAGYATPLVIDRGGIRQLIGWTPKNIRGLDPRTGEPLWSIPFEVNNGTSIAHPIYQDDFVLVSSYYDGCKAIRLGTEPGQAEVAWHDRRNLRALMSQPLYRDGHVYLLDKRHGLTCFELATGNKLWDDDNRMTPKGRNPQATMVWTNDLDRAIVLNSDGDLILTRFNPDGYVELARTNIIGRTWAHPAYAGNCVFARSDTEIVCVLLPRMERSLTDETSGSRSEPDQATEPGTN